MDNSSPTCKSVSAQAPATREREQSANCPWRQVRFVSGHAFRHAVMRRYGSAFRRCVRRLDFHHGPLRGESAGGRGRSAGGIVLGKVRRHQHFALRGRSVLNPETDAGKQIGGGTRPFRRLQAATAIVVLAAIVQRPERRLRRLLFRRHRHPVMTLHRSLRHLARAVRGLRLRGAGLCERHEGRDKRDQQQ